MDGRLMGEVQAAREQTELWHQASRHAILQAQAQIGAMTIACEMVQIQHSLEVQQLQIKLQACAGELENVSVELKRYPEAVLQLEQALAAAHAKIVLLEQNTWDSLAPFERQLDGVAKAMSVKYEEDLRAACKVAGEQQQLLEVQVTLALACVRV
jgi:hypothetical protein